MTIKMHLKAIYPPLPLPELSGTASAALGGFFSYFIGYLGLIGGGLDEIIGQGPFTWQGYVYVLTGVTVMIVAFVLTRGSLISRLGYEINKTSSQIEDEELQRRTFAESGFAAECTLIVMIKRSQLWILMMLAVILVGLVWKGVEIARLVTPALLAVGSITAWVLLSSPSAIRQAKIEWAQY
jgi:hypothetical protein